MISDFFLTPKHSGVLRIFRIEICVSIFPYIKNPMIRPIAGTRETTERMMNNHNSKQYMVYCNRGKEENWIDFANTTMRSRNREIWAGSVGNAQITQLPGPAMTYPSKAHGRISGNSDGVCPSLLWGVQITCRWLTSLMAINHFWTNLQSPLIIRCNHPVTENYDPQKRRDQS
jgi:hypothetical protein